MKPHLASKVLCEQLYELKGWGKDCDIEFYYDQFGQVVPRSTILRISKIKVPKGYVPAYGLGFLLRQLPAEETPEDLIARLIIELDKHNLLQK